MLHFLRFDSNLLANLPAFQVVNANLLVTFQFQKHHYRELSDRVRKIFGSIPDKFVQYWMDRFPKLVLHTWLAMQCVNHEDVFQKYYCNVYTFPRVHDGVTPVWIQQALNSSPRWRLPGRPLVTRYGNNPQNGPFASLYTNGRIQEYNWRQRSKISSDAGPSADDYVTDNKITLQDESVTADDLSPRPTAPTQVDGKDAKCCLENNPLVVGDDDQENVEPDNEADSPSGQVQSKTNKSVRHRRGKNRKKKLCDAGSMLSKSLLPAD